MKDFATADEKGPGRAAERFDAIVIGSGEVGAPKLAPAAGLGGFALALRFGLAASRRHYTDRHSGVTLAGAHAELLAPMIAAGALDSSLAPLSARRFDVPAAA